MAMVPTIRFEHQSTRELGERKQILRHAKKKACISVKLCVLASGSSGNCVYVASASTAILIDAGLSGRETARRLEGIGAGMADVRAVCLTHEHADHRGGIGVLHRRHGLALYGNSGTIEAVESDPRLKGLEWNVFTTGSAFEVGDLRLEPFPVPHDSYDPVGFVVSCGDARAGVVTDMGMPTGAIRERLRDCGLLVVEANHDEALLRDADRPWALKQRIRSRQGHLSNQQACEMLCAIAGPGLRTVFLAHLSSDCNQPDLALKAVQGALHGCGHRHVDVKLTYPDRVSETAEL
jgi:phosphoribosyl 1,2-cyclic phosphodiesterase